MTSKLTFHIHSNHNSFSLEIDNDSITAFNVYLELISIFWNVGDGTITLIPIQKMNPEIRALYNKFVIKYKKNSPKLNRLKNSLDKINDNECYFTSNKASHTAEQILFIGNFISAYNNSSTEEEAAKEFTKLTAQQEDVIGGLLQKYTFTVFDSSQRIIIGESDRNKRICRFCGNGMNTDIKVTFKLKAHALSEALGNKSIVLNEECDVCNSKFGSSIEEDFIKYLDIYRVFYKVKGKNGVPKVKFENGLVQIVDDLMTVISQDIEHDEKTGNLTILLKSTYELTNVNIYKTLCKYALSVIDKNELIYLKKSINWIASEEEKDIKLPKVAVVISNVIYVDTPILGLYIRKDDDYTNPHIVAELRFKSLIFAYLIPFSERDKSNFIDEKTYNLFWKEFKHFSSITNWTFHDFSSFKKSKFQFKMQMNNQKP